MGRFQKGSGKKELPAISTSSLPDIIFILLFFFMVVTVLKESDPLVQLKIPQATELTKLEQKDLVVNIYIGSPVAPYDQELGTAPRIQLNDQFATVEDIPAFVAQSRTDLGEAKAPAMIIALKVDGETTMGIVSDVKQELRKVNALKISYIAVRGLEK